jgi:glucose-1-phosphate adenylyltransferase
MKLLALVLAGGEGTRLQPLTEKHAKPALPFAQGRRIVDFVLSNLVNSGVNRICVLAQYKPESLIRHIESAWGSWLTNHGVSIEILLPRVEPQAALYRGTADAVYRNLDLLERHSPDLVAVFAADHVYRMDVRQMVQFHAARRAEITVAAVPVPVRLASSFGILDTTSGSRITGFVEKPQNLAALRSRDGRVLASMGNYLFDPEVLQTTLRRAALLGHTDFGRDILPDNCRRARMFAYDFTQNQVPGVQQFEEPWYWRDVGTIESLFAARNDVAGPQPRLNLLNPDWPIHGMARAAVRPAREASNSSAGAGAAA